MQKIFIFRTENDNTTLKNFDKEVIKSALSSIICEVEIHSNSFNYGRKKRKTCSSEPLLLTVASYTSCPLTHGVPFERGQQIYGRSQDRHQF